MKKTVYLTICLVLLSVVASCTAQFSEPKGIIEYEGQEVNLSLDGIREVYGWNPQIKDISNEYGNGKGVISVSFPKNWTPDDGYDIFDICYILSDYNVSITSIVIPDGETTIVEEAFGGCSSLTSITLPESLTLIEGGAFKFCTSLTSVTILSDWLDNMGFDVFYGCSSLVEVICSESFYDFYGHILFAGCPVLNK